MSNLLLNIACRSCTINRTVLLYPSAVSLFALQTRGSRYRGHLDPIRKPEDLLTPLAEDDPRRFAPIKAPTNDQCPHLFSDVTLNYFINLVMREGKKVTARRMVYGSLEWMKRHQVKTYLLEQSEEKRATIECNPQIIFHQAVQNCTPVVKTEDVKRGGIVYQVPKPISDKRARWQAMKWIIEISKEKHWDIHFDQSLGTVLLDAFHGEGPAVKRKIELHKLAEANRAYAHYRWS